MSGPAGLGSPPQGPTGGSRRRAHSPSSLPRAIRRTLTVVAEEIVCAATHAWAPAGTSLPAELLGQDLVQPVVPQRVLPLEGDPVAGASEVAVEVRAVLRGGDARSSRRSLRGEQKNRSLATSRRALPLSTFDPSSNEPPVRRTPPGRTAETPGTRAKVHRRCPSTSAPTDSGNVPSALAPPRGHGFQT